MILSLFRDTRSLARSQRDSIFRRSFNKIILYTVHHNNIYRQLVAAGPSVPSFHDLPILEVYTCSMFHAPCGDLKFRIVKHLNGIAALQSARVEKVF